ncbi:hypothetical protein ACA910_015955 [Epithemia clementina (nom. ined.)]
MANFGELVLVLGDLHIPHRASKIPAPFKRMLVPNKMQHVICTGNLSAEDYAELQSLAPNVHVVAGDYDVVTVADPTQHQQQQDIMYNPNTNNNNNMNATSTSTTATTSFPETRVLQVGAFRMGVIHGHQLIPWNSKDAIERMRRKLNVDILVTGHTHQNEVKVLQNDLHFHINPGSITGASSALVDGDVVPSFILLAVQDTKVSCYVYEFVAGEVQVSKTEFTKKALASSGPGAGPEGGAANVALMASLLS